MERLSLRYEGALSNRKLRKREHETFDYKETASATTIGTGRSVKKGLKAVERGLNVSDPKTSDQVDQWRSLCFCMIQL